MGLKINKDYNLLSTIFFNSKLKKKSITLRIHKNHLEILKILYKQGIIVNFSVVHLQKNLTLCTV
jgi:hypothetical protein